MQDIRVDDSFFDHPKTVRFHRRCGDQGIACLFRLWCYASRYFPKGLLTGMSNKEISDAVHWKGDPDEFVNALFEAGGDNKSGFLDLCETHSGAQYGLHNWATRNPYAYHREERSEMARVAANIKWERLRTSINKRKSKADAKRNADGNAERYAPSPAPSPYPLPKKKDLDLPPIERPLVTGGAAVRGALAPPAPPPAPHLLEDLPLDPEVRRLGEVIARRRAELGDG